MQVQDEQEQKLTQQVQDTNHLQQEDDDEFSDDIETIFRREYSKLDTIPLHQPQEICWPAIWLVLVMFFSFVGGAILGIVTYPTVTITIVPLSKHVTITTPLSVSVRQLQPVTLTKQATGKTTGHGHQNATEARGILTFYNGLFTSQTIYAGTVFTAADGIKVVTEETVTILPAAPPQFSIATVSAHAIKPGQKGNISYGDINTTISNGVLVKNSQFTGGRDERDFKTVAQTDVDSLISTLKTTLSQQIPGAFTLRPNENLVPQNCHFATIADHGIGQEASTVTIQAKYTCSGIAYNTQELQKKIDAAFTSTRPGANYQLIGQVSSKVLRVAPFQVQIRGTWVYLLSQDYEEFLAQKIAGKTPEQAKKYLLSTGFIKDATIPASLPEDPGHIHFEILIGAEA
ncbi:MAG TPA: baseplate J/gp47 family protein [Ktedonobacteraceae bacterium]|jgi:hypothetical protein|nr:baseplate J/gp47 family protein [Ktedonobacteraceae bacterium]